MGDSQTYQKDFSPMPVAELLDGKHIFIIPSFQRGYRWEEKQVTDLLEDIKQFADDDSAGNDSYFLQPVVVKETTYNGSQAYEVLDGQQRLTTMLLVLKELLRGYMTPKDTSKYEPLLYGIKYANRPQLDFDNPDAAENIDSYYLSEACGTISKWCDANEDFTNIVRCLFYASAKRQVKIIWYAVDKGGGDIESINIFNRLNKGKISLTSSELIKALFIMDCGMRNKGDELPAAQLSMQWDEMERKFQDDRFWYFISDDNRGTQTRIDVLFDFVTNRGEGLDADYSYREFQKLYDFCRTNERHRTERTFERPWACGIHDMEGAWKLVRQTFDRLVAWYEDDMYYHYIGYLIAVGFTPLQIYNYLEHEKNEKKKEDGEYEWTVDDNKLALQRKIMERFRQKNAYIDKDAIDEFEYGSEYIVRLLLLFNVEYCRKSGNIRFAFDKYKTGSWDVEHVDSQNESTLQEYDDRMRWLRNVRFILEMERDARSAELAGECGTLIDKFEKDKSVNKKLYEDFYTAVNKHYARENGEDESKVDLTATKKNHISNLTLLDSSTNREYKDAPFAYKRYLIMKYDGEGSRFIPPCTRNLFLKYYSDSDGESSYLDTMRWNSADRRNYMEAIHKAVDEIFDSIIKPKEEDGQ